MKKLITIIIGLCLTLSFAFADEPQSMRDVASNGVFSDAWEDVFDPIKLKGIDRFYFFTNFADFNLEYNDMYGDITTNSETKFFEEFPAGIAFTNPFLKNLKHSFFVRLRKNETPEYLGDGNTGVFEEYVTTYEDVTGDDIYDIKTITHNKESDFAENDKLFDFIWNNNIQLGSLNCGLKFSSFKSKDELDNSQSYLGDYDFGNYGVINGFNLGDNQNEMYKEFYELEEENYYFRYSEEGDFSTKIEDDQKKFQLSFEKNNNLLVNDSSLRFDFGLDMHKNLSRDTNDEYNASYEEIILADTLVNSGNITETYNRKIERKENDFYFSTTLKKYLDSSFDNEKGFWETSFNVGYIVGEKEDSWQNHLVSEEKIDSLNSVEYTYIEITDNLSNTDESGDISGVHFGSHFLMNLPLNDYSIFGFGGYYNYSNITGNYDYTSEILNIGSYQIGSSIDTDVEYTQTETEYLSADKQSIISTSKFRIPIALELKIPEDHTSQNDGFGLRNFVFRIGSTFLYNVTKTENTYDVIEKNPNLTITEYGDGTISENHDAENELNSNKEIINRVESSKIFSTGIGYNHSDNLSIDLGGYYNYKTENYLVGVSFTISR